MAQEQDQDLLYAQVGEALAAGTMPSLRLSAVERRDVAPPPEPEVVEEEPRAPTEADVERAQLADAKAALDSAQRRLVALARSTGQQLTAPTERKSLIDRVVESATERREKKQRARAAKRLRRMGL